MVVLQHQLLVVCVLDRYCYWSAHVLVQWMNNLEYATHPSQHSLRRHVHHEIFYRKMSHWLYFLVFTCPNYQTFFNRQQFLRQNHIVWGVIAPTRNFCVIVVLLWYLLNSCWSFALISEGDEKLRCLEYTSNTN